MTKQDGVKQGWEYVRRELDAANRMPTVPANIKKVPIGHIFDPNKPDGWNRDKVAENNSSYMIEAARLITLRNKRRDAAFEEAYRLIQDYIGHGLSRAKAMRIWNYAWGRGYAGGLPEIKRHLQDVADLVKMVLSD